MGSAFNHVRDLNDVALKPRLLRTLINDHLPSSEDSAAFRNPADISAIISLLKTHRLLSQHIPSASIADQKVVSSWSSAVDVWVDRILSLSRSNLPDKCWAGVCLLGVTCAECSSERFLASYSEWFNVLVSHIQLSGVSKFVRVASCAAISDLLTRLGGFSNTKKDGVSHAGKLLQPILKTLNEDLDEDLLEVKAHLLFTVLTFFPYAVHRHYDNVETAIASKLIAGNCNTVSLKKLSCCLALLPKSRGDEESWSLMLQKILISLSSLLDVALDGLEEESRRGEAVTLLVPPGKDYPPALGGQLVERKKSVNGGRSLQFVMSSILSLAECCCTMLTNYYPAQVTVPVSALLAIVRRVLMVNGSLSEALRPFTTAMQQEFVCLQLPALHLNVLEILAALLKGLNSQVLPHAGDIVWPLINYFERCWLPELRTEVYKIIKSLLIMMGAGMALYISQEVINNGLIDLKVADSGIDKDPSTEFSVEASLRHRRKKRKHGAVAQSSVEHSGMIEPQECQASICLKIAAVEALEALITVGGALKSDSWRSGIDSLLMEVAVNACKGGCTPGGKPFLIRGPKAVWEDFQLVSLRAFLASLLSPADVRPPYLAQGFELFHEGKKYTGTKVAEFCAQALVALEVFIHPKALPLVDAPLPSGISHSFGKSGFVGSKYKLPHAFNSVHGVYPDVYDVQDYANMEDGSAEAYKDAQVEGELLDTPRHGNLEKSCTMSGPSDKVTPKERDQGSEPAINNQTGANDDRVMLDVQHGEEPDIASPRTGFAERDHGNDASDLLNQESISGIHAGAAKSNASTTEDGSAVTARADNNSLKSMILDKDDDSSDLFPDIVDADPDTDSDA